MFNFFTRLNTIFSIFLLLIFFNYAVPVVFPIKYPKHIHKTLYIDRSFDVSDVAMIVEAAWEWSEITHHVVDFDLVMLPTYQDINIADAIIINKLNPDSPDILANDLLNKGSTLGIYDTKESINSIGLVEERLEYSYYKAVVLHELGHALGLEHNTGEDGIGTLMYPSIDAGSYQITQTDLNNFCKLYHCDIQLTK